MNTSCYYGKAVLVYIDMQVKLMESKEREPKYDLSKIYTYKEFQDKI